MIYYKVWKKLNEQVNNITFFYSKFTDLLLGDEMAALSKEFADDPCSKIKRQQMIVAARALLTAVTHLLILADLVDVQLILKSIRLVTGFFCYCIYYLFFLLG
jgi:hypothetical protein